MLAAIAVEDMTSAWQGGLTKPDRPICSTGDRSGVTRGFPGKLDTRTQAQLGVDVREVGLDRAG